jgi:RNA polymerase sigma factor (sigma-70 family)
MPYLSSEKGNLRVPSEIALWSQAQAGCRESVNVLMCEHDGLVHAVVRQQVLGELPYEEALQAGRTGLWRAILGYDPERGTAFSTYAWTVIMRSVWAAVKQWSETTTAPLSRALAEKRQEPAREWEKKAVRAAIQQAVAQLPQRLQLVVQARYGWSGTAPTTFRQIGAQLGVSRQRAGQLHEEALMRMRQPAVSYQLRGLLGQQSSADYQMVAAQTAAWLQQRGGRG